MRRRGYQRAHRHRGTQGYEQLLASPNTSQTGKTLLHEAAFYGYCKVSLLLVQRGANTRALDKSGESPLSACRHPPLARELMWADRLRLLSFFHGAELLGADAPPRRSASAALRVLGNADLLRCIVKMA